MGLGIALRIISNQSVQPMLEIILLLMAFGLMAKRTPKRRRSFNLRRVRLQPNLTLGALATITVILGQVVGNSTAPYRMMSLKGTWSISDHTAGQGPITVGFAHSDYSVGEIKEAIEASLSISRGDKIANERANRLVRVVGTFGGLLGEETLNDGRPVKTKLNWAIPVGQTVNMWAYNDSIASLTTGSIIHFLGDCWVKDSQ